MERNGRNKKKRRNGFHFKLINFFVNRMGWRDATAREEETSYYVIECYIIQGYSFSRKQSTCPI